MNSVVWNGGTVDTQLVVNSPHTLHPDWSDAVDGGVMLFYR